MKSINCITRNQLKGYGASSYLARIITKNLQPISKVDCSNVYSLQDVITCLKKYLEKPKIKQKTRKYLIYLLSILIERLNNVIPVVFEKSIDRELNESTKKLFLKMTSLDQKIISSKAQIAAIKGKQAK